MRAPRRGSPPSRASVRSLSHVGARRGCKRCIVARVVCCSAPLGKVLGCRRRRGCLIFVSVLMHRIYRWRTRRQSRHSVPVRKRCWRESNSAFYLRVRFALIHADRCGLSVYTTGGLPVSAHYPAGPPARHTACRDGPPRCRSQAFVSRLPFLFPFYRFLVHGVIGARARIRSFLSDRCAPARLLDRFSKIIVSAGQQVSAMTTRVLA